MKNDYLTENVKRNLRKCQLKQLGILEVIDGICKKHGIDLKKENGLPKEIAEQFITGKDRKD